MSVTTLIEVQKNELKQCVHMCSVVWLGAAIAGSLLPVLHLKKPQEAQTMKYDLIGRGLSFPLKIGSQGRMILTNENNELQQSIMIILMTPIGQRVMRPTFGCRIHELLFAPNNADTISSAQQYVEEALAMWEPRIDVGSVDVFPDPDNHGCLLIDIKYSPKATNDERSLVYPFYLIPEE